MEKIKTKLSGKILEWAGCLPRFRDGFISELQAIRERQQKYSDKDHEEEKIPLNVEVNFEQVTLFLTFEYEDFEKIQRGLKNLFPKNERIRDFIKSFGESADDIQALHWNNLAYVRRDQSFMGAPDMEHDPTLPAEAEQMALSFHRILPSVACVFFDFTIAKPLNKKIADIEKKQYLADITFNNFFPFGKMHYGYSMGGDPTPKYKAISNEKDLLRDEITKWMKKRTKWSQKIIDSACYLDVFQIKDISIHLTNRENWLQENNRWLKNYGLRTHPMYMLYGDNFVYAENENRLGKYNLRAVVAKLDSSDDKDENTNNTYEFMEYKVRPIALSFALTNLIIKHRKTIEKLRAEGFKSIYEIRKKYLKENGNIQEIKKSSVIISRLNNEINQFSWAITSAISDIGDLKYVRRDKKINLGKTTVENLKYHLQLLKEATEIIDTGLTNFISIQSIYAMYRLQKWMLILSAIVTIATLMSVITDWNKIVDFLLLIYTKIQLSIIA